MISQEEEGQTITFTIPVQKKPKAAKSKKNPKKEEEKKVKDEENVMEIKRIVDYFERKV